MLAKKLSSASAASWDSVGLYVVYKPSRTARRTDALRCYLSAALVKPHHAGEAYSNLERAMALQTCASTIRRSCRGSAAVSGHTITKYCIFFTVLVVCACCKINTIMFAYVPFIQRSDDVLSLCVFIFKFCFQLCSFKLQYVCYVLIKNFLLTYSIKSVYSMRRWTDTSKSKYTNLSKSESACTYHWAVLWPCTLAVSILFLEGSFVMHSYNLARL